MTGAELMQGLARGTHVAATLSVFGAILFRTVTASSASATISVDQQVLFGRRLTRLVWLSLIIALIFAALWLLLQAATVTDESGLDQILATLPVVLLETRFGTLLILRVGLLLAACLLSWRMRGTRTVAVAAILAAGAVGIQVGLGHGVSMGGVTGTALIIAELLHLLAAGAWLGGLVPLWIYIGSTDAGSAAIVVRRFSSLGLACVIVLAGTILVQGWILIGGPAGILGTDYGLTATLKGLLFAVLLGLAALNRFHYLPGLATPQGAATQQRLRRSVAVEALVGLLVVLAAGVLLMLAPAIHQQPDWPFALRFSTAALADPGVYDEIMLSLGGLVVALLVLGLATAWRRMRWGAIAVAAIIAWLAIPPLGLLLVPAYPTSFYQSPTGFTAAAIARGSELFPDNCVSCHGKLGRGDGPLAKGLSVPPADLTAGHLFAHSDGELFWWLSRGIDDAHGRLVMPGFADRLSDDDLWNLIDYVRAHNAGLAMHESGQWPQPPRAPDMTVRMENKAVPLSSRHGQMFRLVADNGDAGGIPQLAPQKDLTITTLPLEPGSDAWTAYAVMAATTPDKLAGTEFLVDGDGWLRAVLRPVGSDHWASDADFLAAAREAATHPIATSDSGPMHHHQ